MSKRVSTGQRNTLLNYFQSPKSNGTTSKLTDDSVQNLEITTPKKNVSEIRDGSDGDEDEVVVIRKRRQKPIVSDSDLDSEDDTEAQVKKKPRISQTMLSEEGTSNGKISLNRFKFNTSVNLDSTLDDSITEKDVRADKPEKSTKSYAEAMHQNWLHNKLEFLDSKHIMDAEKRKPDHPDYDSRTIYVPTSFLDKQTPAMRQWWMLKSQHADTVLFFKVGKFYELYHMDAVIGVQQLGFSYMKGDFAHSGFPESAYHKMASTLLHKGFKVARTEQTETPEMMAERCREQRRVTKFDRVVNREICQISTQSTCVYNAQMPDCTHTMPCYMFAISEKDLQAVQMRVGVCFVDTSTGDFQFCEFEDDKVYSRLLTVLAEKPPGMIIVERRKVSKRLQTILNIFYRHCRIEYLASESQFYSASRTVEQLLKGEYFVDEGGSVQLPEALKCLIDAFDPKPEWELALRALGACLWYLQDSKIDIQLMAMRRFSIYQAPHTNSLACEQRNLSDNVYARNQRMVLDSVTLTDLHLIGEHFSLQNTLDHCKTKFGKRMLLQWICRPLCNVDCIRERQCAVSELKGNSELLVEAQGIMKRLPDLERQIAKIHVYGNKLLTKNHPDARAILYETTTYSKRRIQDLLCTLKAFEAASVLTSVFKDAKSDLLRRITQTAQNGGANSDLKPLLEYFQGAFDRRQAEETGHITPKSGIDATFDACNSRIAAIQAEADEYLMQQQKYFRCTVAYFGTDKKRFQLEIPEKAVDLVTSDYQLEGSRKGSHPVRRYTTAKTQEFLSKMMEAELDRSKIVQDLNRRIFERFSLSHNEWTNAVECLSTLDVLCSLAEYARLFTQDICMPVVLPMAVNSSVARLEIKRGRHPCVRNIDGFVPNDTTLGGISEETSPTLLLTGPNMGGKSTLMRQVALIAVMAQVGSYVPAASCTLSVVDRIFTRLGAHDDILMGQSTFMVELLQADCILKNATSNSLVLVDELGRGTSTHDGNAIATAYLEELLRMQCRALFSTHYHSLVDGFLDRTDIQLGHMACLVEENEQKDDEKVTFLYKLAAGRCPKSYGFNVAKLAGLQSEIVARARELSRQLERKVQYSAAIIKLFGSSTVTADTIRSVLESLKL